MLCYRCGNYNGDDSKACAACGQPFTSSIRPIQSKRKREGGPFRVGDVIALRYKVVSFLGEGASGYLYRVSDGEASGSGPRDLVLKLLHPRFMQSSDDRKVFERAVEAATKLQYSGIAQVYGTGEDDGRVFMLSEYCHGLPLSHIVDLRRQQQKSFTVADAEAILAPLCRALEQVHATWVHGAMRPGNVIVQPDEVNVTDFVSWHGLPRQPFVSAMGAEVRYLAPEAREANADLTPAADVHSLGVILRELLVGTTPNGAVLGKAARGLIDRATHAEPRMRPASARVFYEGLLEALEEGDADPVPPLPVTLQPRVVAPQRPARRTNGGEPGGPVITLGGRSHSGERKSRSVWVALLIVALGLIASLAIVWWRSPALFEWAFGPSSEASPVQPSPSSLAIPTFDPNVGVQPSSPKVDTTPTPSFAVTAPPEPQPLPSAPVAAIAPEPVVEKPSDKPIDKEPTKATTLAVTPVHDSKKPVKKPDKDDDDARLPRDSFGCLDGMVFVPGGRFPMGSSPVDEFHSFSDMSLRSVEVAPFCVDRYEYPNQPGAAPMSNISLPDARNACTNKGKRLCKEDEWERACKGPAGTRFPYGDGFEAKACNISLDGTPKGVQAAGQSAQCRSGFGVVDMAGNVSEWTESKLGSSGDFVVKGGDAAHADYTSRCAHRTATAPGKKSSLVGVRCCADPR